jgi:NitT/TauT family transport system substrate-binding protein
MGFFHDQAPTIENSTGKKVEYLLYADYGMNMLGTGLVVHDNLLAKDPDLVRRFVKATQKSWAEAVKNIDPAADAMAQLAEQEPPKNVLVKQLTLAGQLLQGTPGVNTEAKWTETIGLMSQYAELKDAGAASRYWDGSHAGKG